MKLKTVVKLVMMLILSISIIISGCSKQNHTDVSNDTVTGDNASTKTTKWIVGMGAVPVNGKHPFLQAMEYFSELLYEKTEGRYELEIYHSGQLGSDKDMVEGCIIGTYPMVFQSNGYFANYVDAFNMFDFPYLFTSREHAHLVLDSKIGEEILKLLEEHNLIGLAFGESGFRNMTNSKRPIKTPNDLRGLKMRLMDVPIHLETFNVLGANATPMAWGEVFTALAQGTVDGQENLNMGMYSAKLYEVNKYFSITEHFYTPIVIAINKDVFNSLTPEDQQAVREAAKESVIKQREEAERQNQEALAECEKLGAIINTDVDKQAFIDAVKPLYEKYESRYGDYLKRIREMDPQK